MAVEGQRTIETEVLVIGGGAAAARAAADASLVGAKTTIAVKGQFAAICTRGAGASAGGLSWRGGMFTNDRVVPPFDPETDYWNIIASGAGMADPKLVRIQADDITLSNRVMQQRGQAFGSLGVKAPGVSTICALENTIRRQGVEIQQRTMITDLLVQDGRVAGAVGVVEPTGETIIIKAGAVILGTGGNAQMYLHNLHPSCVTGDGYAMGYEVGAELMNMEFAQTYMDTAYPPANILVQSWCWPPPPQGRYLKFTNGKGEEFIAKYLPAGGSVEECLNQKA